MRGNADASIDRITVHWPTTVTNTLRLSSIGSRTACFSFVSDIATPASTHMSNASAPKPPRLQRQVCQMRARSTAIRAVRHRKKCGTAPHFPKTQAGPRTKGFVAAKLNLLPACPGQGEW